MDRLVNPFRPGAGASPPVLIGRDQLIDDFGVTLRRALDHRPAKSLLPVGLRGVGKTVLLNRYAAIAADEGFEVAFIEAPETSDFRLVLASRLRKVLLSLDRRQRRAKAALRALRVLKAFTVQLPDGAQLSIDVEALAGEGDSGVLADDLTDLLVATGEAVSEQRRGFLLVVDELQYLTAVELGALITAIHRTTQLDLPVVLVGAGLPQLPGLAGEAKSYAERLFEFPRLGSLDRADAGAVLRMPVEDLGVTIEDAAVDFVVGETRGYPYFLQEWGYELWNAAPGPALTAADATSVRPIVVDRLDRDFFVVRFERLTPKERQYLRAMAELGPGPHRSGDIATELGVRVESVGPRRSGLIGKGMIYSPAHGDTAFTVPLFDEFLRRRVP